ncbi:MULTISPECIES: Fur family transcriptional regulator [Clostridium]|jgi:Fur family ferric uptake transcriptional regulator|uniref:Transcriptional regulator, Fur family protein n=3 Tax=Clostridium intestinale TaxID=36845 RepID=U2Q4I7_9CLOT|nr:MULTISPECIES: Fur family transcriptional regulator [Clostridium]ERK31009.1 transcriptional regulator, Fur family protein [Clostridium intestinale URNW]QLY81869.1 transcriptional repressor [Clostridium intestinale]WRY52554.1 Fur family transcriptional regulator [Clostridium intestinale]SHH47363.1 Fur family transcriptional regulator, ferric uptake regulator [Clostridium intestinale DSM 6191]
MPYLNEEEVNSLKEDFKKKGYKLTPQRRAIVNSIIKNEGKHLTAEEIYDEVKRDCPEIGLATVYRTILLLEDLGIIYKLDLDDGCARFELAHEGENHRHHHLVCNVCGGVIEVEDDLLDEIEQKIQNSYNFAITDHSVKFFGVCDKCRDK